MSVHFDKPSHSVQDGSTKFQKSKNRAGCRCRARAKLCGCQAAKRHPKRAPYRERSRRAVMSSEYLTRTAERFRLLEIEIARCAAASVEQDIERCRAEAKSGYEFYIEYDRIETELEKDGESGTRIGEWCKKELGVSLRTMQRRKRLYAHWSEYEKKRRDAGDTGHQGLEYALSLVMDAARSDGALSLRNEPATFDGEAPNGCQLICGDSLVELKKIPARSVHCVVTSPPYWPARRLWTSTMGFEPTLEEYLANVVAIMRECKRALRHDGTCFINIGDSYSQSAGTVFPQQGFAVPKPSINGFRRPGSTYLLPAGNLLLIPERLAMLLQTDGWCLRAKIIWHKLSHRPESVQNRPTTDYEEILMLTLCATGYYYDADMIRERPKAPTKGRKTLRFAQIGGNKPEDTMRNDRQRRFWSSPVGQNSGAVWAGHPSTDYHGAHAATMPLELAERCILVGCPEDGTVLDPFGGAATTALAAARHGRKAISIEIDPSFHDEGRQQVVAWGALMISKTGANTAPSASPSGPASTAAPAGLALDEPRDRQADTATTLASADQTAGHSPA